ncbi:MAG: glycosyltransferase family 4 protein [Thermoplasmatales archaeon]
MKFQNIVFVQLSGRRGEKGAGGGIVDYERLAKYLVNNGKNVYAITNNLDKLGFDFLGERRFSANFREGSGGIRSIFLYNMNRLREELKRICSLLDVENSFFVTVDPFPPDIAGVRVLRRIGARNIAVSMHHITPSPLWHPFRRGIKRVFPAWMISVYALAVIKLKQIPVFLDNPRIAETTGWKIKTCLIQPSSLGDYKHISPDHREMNVVFTGRLVYNKGIIDLIRAWRIISRECKESKLILIGSNFIGNKLERLLEKYSMKESVEIKGFLSRDEMERILVSSAVFLFPSYEEGWALSVMEAVDHGVLPVTYDLPAYDYLGSEAIKVRPGDIRGLAKEVVYYLKNNDQREEKVKKLQDEISKYTMDYVAKIWLSQLDSSWKQ